MEHVVIKMDGSSWMAHYSDFVNVQESVCGHGTTPLEAVVRLAEQVRMPGSQANEVKVDKPTTVIALLVSAGLARSHEEATMLIKGGQVCLWYDSWVQPARVEDPIYIVSPPVNFGYSVLVGGKKVRATL